MSEFNKCAALVNTKDLLAAETMYASLLNSNKDPMQALLDLQNSLQEDISEKHGRVPAPKKIKTKGELYQFVLDQKIAIDDEWREMVEAIAGMSLDPKDRSALWKKWKKQYGEVRAGLTEDLSPEDRLELMFEAIDICHFWNNVLLALDIDAKTMFVLYFLKNAENFSRQERGY